MHTLTEAARTYCRHVVDELPQAESCAAFATGGQRLLASFPHRVSRALGEGIGRHLVGLVPRGGELFLASSRAFYIKLVEDGRLVLLVTLPRSEHPQNRWQALRRAVAESARLLREAEARQPALALTA